MKKGEIAIDKILKWVIGVALFVLIGFVLYRIGLPNIFKNVIEGIIPGS